MINERFWGILPFILTLTKRHFKTHRLVSLPKTCILLGKIIAKIRKDVPIMIKGIGIIQ